MSIFSIWIQAFRKICSLYKMVILLWLANIGFGLLLVLPLDTLLSEQVGKSPIFANLFEGFNYEIFMELRRELDIGFSLFLDQSLYTALAYFLFSIFLLGGILMIIRDTANHDNQMGFWQAAGYYFLPLLGLSLLFLLVFGICGGLCGWMCFSGGLNPFELATDMDLVKPIFVFIPCFLVFYALLSLVNTIAKIRLVQYQSKNILGAIIGAFSFVKSNLISCLSLFAFNSILMVSVFFLGIWLCGCIDSSLFFITFLIAQFFIIVRIFLRVLNLCSFDILMTKQL